MKIISKLRYGFIRIVKPFSRKKYNKLFYSHLKKLGVNIIGTPNILKIMSTLILRIILC